MPNKVKTTKKIPVLLADEYNPRLVRARLTRQYRERFFKLFFSIFDFEGTVSEEERFIIVKQFWETGSTNVSRSPAPLKVFEKEMDLTFTKYAVDDYDFNMRPLHCHNAPLKTSRAVKRGRLMIGKDCAIVYLNELAMLKPNYGAMRTAENYISQIVNAKMTIQTNILLHKMPFLVGCSEDEADTFKEILRKIFSDEPAVFAPLSMNGRDLNAVSPSVPYIIDKLESYCVRLENMFLDEIGLDNAKPVQAGQDRLLLDETNANNAIINNFRHSIFDTIQEGFDQVKTLFGREIRVKPYAPASASVHEEINGEGEAEGGQPEEGKEENKA